MEKKGLTYAQHLSNLYSVSRDVPATAKVHDQLKESYAALLPVAKDADAKASKAVTLLESIEEDGPSGA